MQVLPHLPVSSVRTDNSPAIDDRESEPELLDKLVGLLLPKKKQTLIRSQCCKKQIDIKATNLWLFFDHYYLVLMGHQ